MLKQLALAAFAAVTFLAVQSPANAGWGCRTCDYLNGTQHSGIAVGSASTGSVSTVILPMGEIVDVR